MEEDLILSKIMILFLIERNLVGEFNEWCTEQKADDMQRISIIMNELLK